LSETLPTKPSHTTTSTLPLLKAFRSRIDPRAYNGASLLGLSGIVIKSHGSADVFAYANAIEIAVIEIEKAVPNHIRERMEPLLEKAV
jgi:glycerol-3-phosphate acyltransferase PlsX